MLVNHPTFKLVTNVDWQAVHQALTVNLPKHNVSKLLEVSAIVHAQQDTRLPLPVNVLMSMNVLPVWPPPALRGPCVLIRKGLSLVLAQVGLLGTLTMVFVKL